MLGRMEVGRQSGVDDDVTNREAPADGVVAGGALMGAVHILRHAILIIRAADLDACLRHLRRVVDSALLGAPVALGALDDAELAVAVVAVVGPGGVVLVGVSLVLAAVGDLCVAEGAGPAVVAHADASVRVLLTCPVVSADRH